MLFKFHQAGKVIRLALTVLVSVLIMNLVLSPISPVLADDSSLVITPPIATLATGGSITFSADEDVTWSVIAVPGVNTGSISNDGVYTAPSDRVPPGGTVTIVGIGQVTGLRGTATLYIRSTDADATFHPVTQVQAGTTMVADVDGDGLPDLVEITSNRVYVHVGQGDGTFAPPTEAMRGASTPTAAAVLADVDGDGNLDLVGIRGYDPARLYVHRGNGDGTFTSTAEIHGFVWARDLIVADLNGNGHMDIALVEETYHRVRVLLNDGSGNFGVPAAYDSGGERPFTLTAGDLNGNGLNDLVVANHTEGTLVTLLNQGGTFGAPHQTLDVTDWSNFPSIRQLALGDVNADGQLDVVAGLLQGRVAVYLGNGDGTFAETPASTISGGPRFALGHLDNDDYMDLAVATSSGIEIWAGSSTGEMSHVHTAAEDRSVSLVSVTELNNDGRYDLVARLNDGSAWVTATLLGGPVADVPVTLTITPETATVNSGKSLELLAQVTGTLDNEIDWTANTGSVEVISHSRADWTAPDPAHPAIPVTITAALAAYPDISVTIDVSLTDIHWSRSVTGLWWVDTNCLAWSADGSLLYAGTGARVFRSDDGGLSWMEASGSDGHTVPGPIISLAVDPNDPLTVYAGRTSGIYKTTDGGQTWAPANNLGVSVHYSLGGAVIHSLLVHPGDSNTVFAAVDLNVGLPGLFRSTDAGATWYPVESPEVIKNPMHSLSASADGSVIYGTTASNLFRSTDGGATWEGPIDGLAGHWLVRVMVDPFDPDHVMVSTQLPGSLLETRDGGLTWTDLSKDLPSNNRMEGAFSPVDPGTLLLYLNPGMGPLLSQSPEETRFHDISNGMEKGLTNWDVRAFAVAPAGEYAGAFYAATENGVYIANLPVEIIPTLIITPSIATVALGESITFGADEEDVAWSIVPVPGVDTGSINEDGIYTAPADRVPPNGAVTIIGIEQATGLRGTATVYIRSTDADATFQPATQIETGITLTGDVDGDGIPDLVEIASNRVYVHLGQGDGTFAPPVEAMRSARTPTEGAVLADVDGDGNLDLVGIRGYEHTRLYVHRGNGDGTFTAATEEIYGFAWARDLVVADLNGNGHLDIALVEDTYNRVRVLLNNGLGVFGIPSYYNSGGERPFTLAAGDINGNGLNDLVVANHTEGTLVTLINQGGTFSAPHQTLDVTDGFNFPSIRQLALGDVNGNSHLDIVVGLLEGQVAVYLGNGDGTFAEAPASTISGASRFALGHFNSNDYMDIAVATGSGIDIWTGSSTGEMSYLHTAAEGRNVSLISVTELNNDGCYDLVARLNDGSAWVTAILLGGPVAEVPVTLTVTPEEATVNSGKSLELLAQVTGTLDNQVEWTASHGSIEVISHSRALWTAPDPADSETIVIITAILVADSGVSAGVQVNQTDIEWMRSVTGLDWVDVQCLAWSADGSLLYAGTPAGVFRSDNGGQSWTAASGSDGHTVPGPIISLAVDPNDPLTVYAGRTSGIYKTIDGGQTWAPSSNLGVSVHYSLGGAVIHSLLVHPGDSNTVFAAVDLNVGIPGLFRSTDAGATWYPVESPAVIKNPMHSLSASADGSTIYATTAANLFRSTDGGATWEGPIDGLAGHWLVRVMVDPFDADHVLVITQLPGRLLETRDGGLTWTDLSKDLPSSNYMEGAFSPVDPSTILLYLNPGMGPLLSQSPSETLFHDISNGMEKGLTNWDVRAFAVAPAGEYVGAFYAATENGVYIANFPVEIIPTLIITPSIATVALGESITLSAEEEDVAWSIVPVPGVDTGSISEDGVYTAPSDRVPPGGSVTIAGVGQETGLRGTATVYIRSTDADATFQPVTQIETGTILTGDVNGDGIPDLVEITSNHVYVHLGQGDGTFAPPIEAMRSSRTPTEGAVLADIDGDGNLDLVGIRGYEHTRLYVHRGNGDGTFTAATEEIYGFVWARDLVVADLNGNGHLDIALVEEAYDRVRVLLNNGLGGFGIPAYYPSGGERPFTLAAGDLNANGLNDLVVANHTEGTLVTLLNQGGTFSAPFQTIDVTDWSNFPSIWQLALGDVNADGHLDIVAGLLEGQVAVYLGNGDGTFAEAPASTISGASRFALGHFNSDDYMDLAVATGSGIDIWTGSSTGEMTYAGTAAEGRNVSLVSVTELNNDGRYDLVARLNDGSAWVTAIMLGGPVTEVPVTLTVTPEEATVNSGKSLELLAQVTGTLDNQVEWTASHGSIEVLSHSRVLWTAPDPADPETTVIITATLVADPTISIEIHVGLTDYHWSRSVTGMTNTDVRCFGWSADGSILYAGTGAGVFRSNDGGQSWTAASGSDDEALPDEAILSLAVAPKDPLTVYAGTVAGIYKTTDGGQTWAEANNLGVSVHYSLGGAVVHSLLVHPSDSNIVLAAVDLNVGLPGLFRSTDAGATWYPVESPEGIENPVHSLSASADGSAIYATTAANLFRSTDGGATWEGPIAGLEGHWLVRVMVNPFDAGHVLVSTQLPGSLLETRDGGLTWTDLSKDLPSNNRMEGAFSPVDAGTLLLSLNPGMGPLLSQSPSETRFHDISTGMEKGATNWDVRAFAIAPVGAYAGVFYAATENGVYIANFKTASAEADILTFSFPQQTGPATIDSVTGTIGVEVEHGTDLTSLVATFTASPGSSVRVDGVVQTSGVTINDFSSTVTYIVMAEDGMTINEWAVTVTEAAPEEYALTIHVVGDGSVDLYPEQATYTYGEVVSLTAAAGTGWTFSHWSGDLAGTNHTETIVMDGDKIVTAEFARVLSSEAEILSYSLPEQKGPAVIGVGIIHVEVVYGTDVTALVAAFTSSPGSTVRVDGVVQTSSVTVNDFTSPLVYTVSAEDGTIKYWTVTVTVGPALVLQANVEISPQTLNLRAQGRWITAYIEAPEGYAIETIDIGTVRLQHEEKSIGAEWGEIQDDGRLMVRFDWTTVAAWFDGIHNEEVELSITGEINGRTFEGVDTVNVITPPGPRSTPGAGPGSLIVYIAGSFVWLVSILRHS